MSSHLNSKVNDKSKEYINRNYGKHCEVRENVEKVHEYLEMTLGFIEKIKVKN